MEGGIFVVAVMVLWLCVLWRLAHLLDVESAKAIRLMIEKANLEREIEELRAELEMYR